MSKLTHNINNPSQASKQLAEDKIATVTRRQYLRAGIAALACAPIAVGCASQPLLPPIAAPDFTDLPPLNFSVSSIEIENLHDDRATYPHTEALSPHPPASIIERWIAQVMRPAKGDVSNSLLTVRIIDASLIEEKLPRAPGLSGLFIVEQTEAYHGHVLLELQALFPDFEGKMIVESQASQTVEENTSLRTRQQVWVELGNKMVRDIDRTLRTSLPQRLPRLLLMQ